MSLSPLLSSEPFFPRYSGGTYHGRKVVGHGKRTDIPASPDARLMYYMNCVRRLLNMNMEGDLTWLRHYRNRSMFPLSGEMHDFLIELCIVYSPRYLCGTVIFKDDYLHFVPNGVVYEVYDRKDEPLEVRVYARQTTTVRRIMTCTEQWLVACWRWPMQFFKQRMADIMPSVDYRRWDVSRDDSQEDSPDDSRDVSSCCCCAIL